MVAAVVGAEDGLVPVELLAVFLLTADCLALIQATGSSVTNLAKSLFQSWQDWSFKPLASATKAKQFLEAKESVACLSVGRASVVKKVNQLKPESLVQPSKFLEAVTALTTTPACSLVQAARVAFGEAVVAAVVADCLALIQATGSWVTNLAKSLFQSWQDWSFKPLASPTRARQFLEAKESVACLSVGRASVVKKVNQLKPESLVQPSKFLEAVTALTTTPACSLVQAARVAFGLLAADCLALIQATGSLVTKTDKSLFHKVHGCNFKPLASPTRARQLLEAKESVACLSVGRASVVKKSTS